MCHCRMLILGSGRGCVWVSVLAHPFSAQRSRRTIALSRRGGRWSAPAPTAGGCVASADRIEHCLGIQEAPRHGHPVLSVLAFIVRPALCGQPESARRVVIAKLVV